MEDAAGIYFKDIPLGVKIKTELGKAPGSPTGVSAAHGTWNNNFAHSAPASHKIPDKVSSYATSILVH